MSTSRLHNPVVVVAGLVLCCSVSRFPTLEVDDVVMLDAAPAMAAAAGTAEEGEVRCAKLEQQRRPGNGGGLRGLWLLSSPLYTWTRDAFDGEPIAVSLLVLLLLLTRDE